MRIERQEVRGGAKRGDFRWRILPVWCWVGGVICGIEMGGTKTVVAIGRETGEVIEEFRYETTDGKETFARAIEWFSERGNPQTVGVAAFGPVDVNPSSEGFGSMLATPKPGWQGFSIRGALATAFPDAAFALDTDVNAAALAEAGDLQDLAYITIGTGIGGGILSGGRLVHGALHPEFGHWRPVRAKGDDFEGVCPFHGDCLEGLASGPSMAKRWGKEAKDLPLDHPAWDFEVHYLAEAVMTLLATVSTQRVVIGGGVSQAEGFHARVEKLVRERAAGYFPVAESEEPFVVAPRYGQQAGIRGALLLAVQALGE
ncbi:fructokinase [Haloferula luteola]|uniref:fructokinase n=1 Tax=Haloferula luteola TaxID=595692 RepID=A0A840V315_9BACT|nr:ROK family protein [Haloferula luteola]MBB5352385.1 fructokinase [Haloferula luteola]